MENTYEVFDERGRFLAAYSQQLTRAQTGTELVITRATNLAEENNGKVRLNRKIIFDAKSS